MGSRANESIEVAVVGAGRWGANVVRNFAELGALRLIADIQGERLAQLAASFPDAGTCTSLDEVLGREDISAVAIATPSTTHAKLARQALLAGKDVFVEKPLCLSASEGRELVELARAEDRILMVGHLLHYHPAVRRLHDLIEQGELGNLLHVVSNRLSLGRVRPEETALWSLAPHDVSLALGLAGEAPSRVKAWGASHLNPGGADAAGALLEFPSGITVRIEVSWLHPFKDHSLIVIGDRAMAVFDDNEPVDKLRVYDKDLSEWDGQGPAWNRGSGRAIPCDGDEPLRAECKHFLECVETRAMPRTAGSDAVRVLDVLEACQRSLDGMGLDIRTASSVSETGAYIHPTADVEAGAEVGAGSRIWRFCHVASGAVIGRGSTLGQGCHVAGRARVGDGVKVQNGVSLYSGVVIEDDAFLGPACVFTNIPNPRSQVARGDLYETTTVRRGATIGANASIVCGVEVGRYAFVAAGAVVTRDVADYALVMGNPARQVGWMSRHGHRLQADGSDTMLCPESGYRYKEVEPGCLRCLDLDEEQPLPPEMATGHRYFWEYKSSPASGKTSR